MSLQDTRLAHSIRCLPGVLPFLYCTGPILRSPSSSPWRYRYLSSSSPNGSTECEDGKRRPTVQAVTTPSSGPVEGASFFKQMRDRYATNKISRAPLRLEKSNKSMTSKKFNASNLTRWEKEAFDNIFAGMAIGRQPSKHVETSGNSLESTSDLDPISILALFNQASTRLRRAATLRERSRTSLTPEEESQVQRYPKILRKAAAAAMLKAKKRQLDDSWGKTEEAGRGLGEKQMASEMKPSVGNNDAEASLANDRIVDYFCNKEMQDVSQALLKAAESSHEDLWTMYEQRVLSLPACLEIAEKEARTLDLYPRLSDLPPNLRVSAASILLPALMLLTARLFTTRYGQYSTYPTRLLESLRSQSFKISVLATSTALFNTLLNHRWTFSSDLGEMDNLLQEMEDHCVKFDEDTLAILDRVAEAHKAEVEANNGKNNSNVHERDEGSTRTMTPDVDLVSSNSDQGEALTPQEHSNKLEAQDKSCIAAVAKEPIVAATIGSTAHQRNSQNQSYGTMDKDKKKLADRIMASSKISRTESWWTNALRSGSYARIAQTWRVRVLETVLKSRVQQQGFHDETVMAAREYSRSILNGDIMHLSARAVAAKKGWRDVANVQGYYDGSSSTNSSSSGGDGGSGGFDSITQNTNNGTQPQTQSRLQANPPSTVWL